MEEIHFGARSDTVLALVYEKELIYPKFLEEVKQQIAGWEVDGVFDSGMVEIAVPALRDDRTAGPRGDGDSGRKNPAFM